MLLIKIKQFFKGEELEDIKTTITDEINKLKLKKKKGSRIAIAVGSRGITNLPLIVKTVSGYLKKKGYSPFIVPAMGSHGGATAKGQLDILNSLGINEKKIGIPILSSMEVKELPQGNLKNRVFMDKHAFYSDGVILINRVKPHTDFNSTYESGLVKMCVIGLGKHKQALEIHQYGVNGLKELTPATAKQILSYGKILMGLAIVEDALDRTAIIRALDPEDIIKEEPGLLRYAKENMPSLPVDRIDVLIVDELGKDISGTGLDPNIIGRLKIRGEKEPEKPDIKNIIITDITPGSHGNAAGIGFADVVTERLSRKINFSSTYENVITATFIERGKLPIVAKNARKALNIALRACGPLPSGKERIVRIKNTLLMEEMYVSPAVLEEIKDRVKITGDSADIFDKKGKLKKF